MNANEDLELVENVKTKSCNKSLEELISKHSALCVDISKKYAPALYASGIPINDIIQEKEYLVYKSALSFNPEKNVKFSTWLGNQVRYHCLNMMNQNKSLIKSENDELDYFANQADLLEDKKFNIEIEYIFNILSKLKDPRIKEVFIYRYFKATKNKMPWSKIAKKLNISTQTAINLHKRGIEILSKKMKSNTPDVV